MPVKNLIGQKFGKLMVVQLSHTGSHGREYICKCDCGQIKTVRGSTLTSGRILGCGCSIGLSNIGRTKDQNARIKIGQKYGRLTIVDIERKQNKRGYMMICKCECGRITKVVYADLFHGKTRSCNCLQRETISEVGSRVGINNSTKGTSRFRWNHKGIAMRSGYEVMFAQVLERKGVYFEYEPKCFVLTPKIRYTPDFYIPSENKYYEVKGWLKKSAIEKIEMLRDTGVKVQILFLPDIEKEHTSTYACFKKQWLKEQAI